MNKLFLGLILILLVVTPVFFIKCKSDVGNDKPLIINIQPLDGIKNVDKVAADFRSHYLTPLGIDSCTINILPHALSPDSALNTIHTRYRAIKLVNHLHNNTPEGEFTIGITDKDISTSIHGADDYGILGIAFLGNKKRACITSTYRLRYKADLWKLVAHEFSHGFFSKRHCEVDDPHCIMQDAKGKSPRFEEKEYLCPKCVSLIDAKIHQADR